MLSVCVTTRLFVDCPHIQLEAANGETPQHLGVHDLPGRTIEAKDERKEVNVFKMTRTSPVADSTLDLQSLTLAATLNDSGNITRLLLCSYLLMCPAHRQFDDLVEEDLLVGEDVKHEVLTDGREAWRTVNSRRIQTRRQRCFSSQFCSSYLVVKGRVGRFLHRRLLLLVSDLDHHAGVDVFSHQLSGLRDVNGNLLVRVKDSPPSFRPQRTLLVQFFWVWLPGSSAVSPHSPGCGFSTWTWQSFSSPSVQVIWGQFRCKHRSRRCFKVWKKVKPLGVWDHSAPDFGLVFGTFLLGLRRCLLHVSVCG